MAEAKRVLVTGATGKQGGAVARALRERGQHVRALVRSPDSDGARALAALGAELARGDFDDTASLRAAMQGVDAVFAMSTPFVAGPDVETAQGKAVVVAAKLARVPHLVYSSVGGADRRTGIPHFESKRRVEEAILESGVAHTILGPVFFMENFVSPFGAPRGGKLAMPLPPDRKLQMVDVRSIGRFAALVIERGAPFHGRRIDLASDEKSGVDSARILGAALGERLEYMQVPLEIVRADREDAARMFEWFDRVGYQADVAGLRRDYPEIGWSTLEEWVARARAVESTPAQP